MSKLQIIENGEEMTLEEVVKTDAGTMKNLLKEKWKQVNGEAHPQ